MLGDLRDGRDGGASPGTWSGQVALLAHRERSPVRRLGSGPCHPGGGGGPGGLSTFHTDSHCRPFMESAHCKTLIEIASASQRITHTLDRNVGRKTTESAQLDKILVGTRTVLEGLNKTLFLKDGNADNRLVDWLNSDSPHACLRTLNQMEEILSKKPEYGLRSFFNASRSTHTQDKNDEAMRLFQMRKSYFHFLLMEGIW